MRRALVGLAAFLVLVSFGCRGTEPDAKRTPPSGAAAPAAEPTVAGGAAADQAGAAGADQAAAAPGAEQSPAPAEPTAAPVLPQPDLGYNAREGRALYRHYCSTCHGDEGHGDGFNAYNLDPKPRDLADPAFQAKRTDDDLASIIRSGGGVAGLSTGMPPWGRVLKDRQIRNLVDYIRTLKGSSD